jgi:hypothetical protein
MASKATIDLATGFRICNIPSLDFVDAAKLHFVNRERRILLAAFSRKKIAKHQPVRENHRSRPGLFAGPWLPVFGYWTSATISLLGSVPVAPVSTGIGAVTALAPCVAPKLSIVQYRAVGEHDLIQTPGGIARFSGV